MFLIEVGVKKFLKNGFGSGVTFYFWQ